MKNIARLSLILSVVFLLVTANKSNASTQSQQGTAQVNFKQGYLINNAVNSIDAGQPRVLLARSWGKHRSKSSCFNKGIGRSGARRYYSRTCKKVRHSRALRIKRNRARYKAKQRARRASIQNRRGIRRPQNQSRNAAALNSSKARISQLEGELSRVRAEAQQVGQLKARVAQLEGGMSAARAQAQNQIAPLQAKIQQLEGGLSAATAEAQKVAPLQAKIGELEQSIAAQVPAQAAVPAAAPAAQAAANGISIPKNDMESILAECKDAHAINHSAPRATFQRMIINCSRALKPFR